MGIGYKADYNFVSVAFKTATKKKKISPPSNEYEKQGLSKTVLTRRKRISFSPGVKSHYFVNIISHVPPR